MASPLRVSRPNPSTVAIAGVVKTSGSSNSNPRKNPEQRAKQTQGRRKIEIKKIDNRNKKHVTFSKRRNGLVKKASELCAMCGVSVAVVTFSDAGKAFSFGHPSPDAVFHRYLHGGGSASSCSPGEAVASHAQDIKPENTEDPLFAGVGVDDQNLPWWDQPIEELGLDELEAFAGSLEQMRSNVESRIADMDFERSKAAIAVNNVDIDEHHLAGMAGEMNNNYFVPPHFLALPPPDIDHQYQQYQVGYGCGGVDDDDGIGKIVASNFNRFSSGFGEF